MEKMRIYITHCSAKKDSSFKDTREKVTPDRLYSGRKIQNFIKICRTKQVNWALFSDMYGIWFPNEKHEWYEKSPDDVTEEEFRKLLENFNKKLQSFDEIWFLHNIEDFHPMYQRLVKETTLKSRIHLFVNTDEIV